MVILSFRPSEPVVAEGRCGLETFATIHHSKIVERWDDGKTEQHHTTYFDETSLVKNHEAPFTMSLLPRTVVMKVDEEAIAVEIIP